MDSDNDFTERMRLLREKALERLGRRPEQSEPAADNEVLRLLHDLNVHQIELELQNEELRAAQQELQRSHDRYLDLYHHAPVGYVVADAVGMVLQANQTLAAMLNREIADLLQKPLADMIHPEDQELYYARYRAFYKDPKGKTLEFRIVSSTGGVLDARCEGHRIESSVNSGTGRDLSGQLLISISDITHQKKAERELLRTRNLESIGTLAGGLAHDFNNILAALVGHLELARIHWHERGKADLHLDKSMGAAMRARDLSNRLVTFAEGGTPLTRPKEIHHIVSEAVESSLQGSQVRCDLQLPSDLHPVIVDEVQMMSALQHIICNAREAMSRRGRLWITAQNVQISSAAGNPLLPGTYVRIEIRDQGPGIDPVHLGKIFDPYFTTKEMGSKKGMGLGLTITHSIVKKHNGHIQVDSTPGQGTLVTVYLPALPVQAAKAPILS
ncbi:two-component system sensor histidine kinase NtrB [Desulfatitalea tepidiphila]|uniref:two-component system sensor histidine kinase NtrB n=1 Tax=Desulfatitalea tepidiphila TaxID=1185843 RepID=UPI0006B412B6|nr:ATP-binding protein [Desulfatitalea tepidiphila]